MYLNDLLEIKTNKNDSFNLRIQDKCLYLNDDDIITFVLYDSDGFKTFTKDCLIYKGIAYLSLNSDDVKIINIGEYTYSIYAKIISTNQNDTIIYKNKFTMEG